MTYIMHGEKLLTGTVVIKERGGSGIFCDHCNAVISCSAFEAHAGVWLGCVAVHCCMSCPACVAHTRVCADCDAVYTL